jgi:excisionase family DNA binding protein
MLIGFMEVAMPEEDKMLNIAAAAEVLGVHKNTLRTWADNGLVPHVKLPSGYRRFRLSEMKKMVQEMEQGVKIAA